MTGMNEKKVVYCRKDCFLFVDHPREPECGHPYWNNEECYSSWITSNTGIPKQCPLRHESYKQIKKVFI